MIPDGKAEIPEGIKREKKVANEQYMKFGFKEHRTKTHDNGYITS